MPYDPWHARSERRTGTGPKAPFPRPASVLKQGVYTVLSALSQFASQIWSAMKQTASFVWNGIKTTVVNIASALREAAVSAFQRMVSDRKSTRLNSSHVSISYAVFCLKKKK